MVYKITEAGQPGAEQFKIMYFRGTNSNKTVNHPLTDAVSLELVPPAVLDLELLCPWLASFSDPVHHPLHCWVCNAHASTWHCNMGNDASHK